MELVEELRAMMSAPRPTSLRFEFKPAPPLWKREQLAKKTVACCDGCMAAWRLAFLAHHFVVDTTCTRNSRGALDLRAVQQGKSAVLCQDFHFKQKGICRWLAGELTEERIRATVDHIASGTHVPLVNPMPNVAYKVGGLYPKSSFCATLHAARLHTCTERGDSSGCVHSFNTRLLQHDETITFPCWNLPAHTEKLRDELVRHVGTERRAWIVKPTDKWGGIGLRYYESDDALLRTLGPGKAVASSPLKPPSVVQPFLRDPALFRGRKFDLRAYALATSLCPLRIYLFSEALVRTTHATYDESDDATRFTNFKHQKNAYGRNATVSNLVVSVATLASSLNTTPRDLMDPLRVAVAKIFLLAESVNARKNSQMSCLHKASHGWHLYGVDAVCFPHLCESYVHAHGRSPCDIIWPSLSLACCMVRAGSLAHRCTTHHCDLALLRSRPRRTCRSSKKAARWTPSSPL